MTYKNSFQNQIHDTCSSFRDHLSNNKWKIDKQKNIIGQQKNKKDMHLYLM